VTEAGDQVAGLIIRRVEQALALAAEAACLASDKTQPSCCYFDHGSQATASNPAQTTPAATAPAPTPSLAPAYVCEEADLGLGLAFWDEARPPRADTCPIDELRKVAALRGAARAVGMLVGGVETAEARALESIGRVGGLVRNAQRARTTKPNTSKQELVGWLVGWLVG
jgi:hypothetical protein